MNEPSHLTAVRESYDTIAADYVERVPSPDRLDPLSRAMLTAFTDLVRAAGSLPVADLGCGPGRLTAHLAARGVTAFGVDLSPRMIELARAAHPDVRFVEGSMHAMDLADARLGGILAWYSTHHTPPASLPDLFAEFHRVLAPGGHLLWGDYIGAELLNPARAYGHPVSYTSYLLPLDRVADLLGWAGLTVTARLVQEPGEGVNRPHACLLARRPERP
ncbi:class I SAM-dependent methyltransferase [Streptomyces sp. NPDC002039]|uniref:class I SAM-dependent methyltransferase n=1 Tax=Streptomyces sp. NPDC002039 TaxID=3154660 RepID=UPI00331EC64D